jgi:hypothetical protein
MIYVLSITILTIIDILITIHDVDFCLQFWQGEHKDMCLLFLGGEGRQAFFSPP